MAVKKYKPIKIDFDAANKATAKAYDPSKQVEGYKKRIEGSGLDADKALDKRNWFEKLTNLTPDQNALFDIFEIIERPQRAMFGGMKAMQEGTDIMEGIKTGITGKDVVKFKEVLHNLGVADSKDTFGVDDVAGFVGEVFLDPVDLAIWGGATLAAPVTGGGSLGVAAGATTAMNAAQAAGKATDVMKAADTVIDVAKAGKKARRISTLQLAGRGTKKAIGGSLRIADGGLTRAFTKMDDWAKAGQDAKVAAGLIKKQFKMLDSYNDIKKNINAIFDVAKSLPAGMWNDIRRVTGKEPLLTKKLGFIKDDAVKYIDDAAVRMGKDSDVLGREIMEFIEFDNYVPNTTIREILTNGTRKGGTIDNDTRELVEDVLEMVRKEHPHLTDVRFDKLYGSRKMANGRTGYFIKNEDLLKKVLGDTQGKMSNNLASKFDDVIKNPRFYSEAEKEAFEALRKNADFMEAVNYSTSKLDEMVDLVDEAFETSMKLRGSEGYVRHAATGERKVIPKAGQLTVDGTSPSQLLGNMSAFNGRKYKMSAKEANMIANEQIQFMKANNLLNEKQLEFWNEAGNIKVFEDTLQASIGDFIEFAPNFAKTHRMMDNVLVKSFMENNELVRKAAVGENKPVGMQMVGSADLKRKLKMMEKNIDSPAMTEAISKLDVEGVMFIDNNVYNAIGRLGDHKDVPVLLSILDASNNLFKKTKLLSPGFQMRNIVGNLSNIYLSGANLRKFTGDMKYANKIFKQGDDLLRKSMQKGTKLTPKEDEMLKFYTEFVENGFHNIASKTYDIDEVIAKTYNIDGTKKGLHNRIMRGNAAANQYMDERYRMAMLIHAKKNPSVLRRAGLEVGEEAALVRRVLFDPGDLSLVEREVARRSVPFYTFAKKNLAFQMKNIFDNPVKYKRLKKAVGQVWESQGIDELDIEQYKRENFWIPIPGMTKDGKYTALKVNLPTGDLADFMGNPARKIISSVSPMVRAPFEMVMNKQVFTNRPISEFKGQKGFMIPEMSRKAEYLLGQSGLDVPVSLGMDMLRTGKKVATGQTEGASGMELANQALGRSVTSTGDVAKAKLTRDYQELQQVTDLMKYYKQEKIDILTLAEIENKNPTLNALEARLKELTGK